MKKIFIFFFILFLILATGLAVFVLTFDANSYRPFIIRQIENQTGKPVDLDYISLTWRGGLALQLNRLVIYSDSGKKEPPAVEVDGAALLLDLMPFLRRQVEISSIRFDGLRLHLVRDADGLISIKGLEPEAPPPGPAEALRPSPGPVRPEAPPPAVREGPSFPLLPFLISHFEIENGRLLFSDQTKQIASDIVIHNLDIKLKNISPIQPVDFMARAAVFSDFQNIQLEGRFRMHADMEGFSIDDVRVESDLGYLDLAKVNEAFPHLLAAGIRDKLVGQLMVHVESLDWKNEQLEDFIAGVQLKSGKLSLAALQRPLVNMDFDLTMTKHRLHVKEVVVDYDQGKLFAQGAVERWMDAPSLTFECRAEGLPLETVAPHVAEGEPYLSGKLYVNVRGSSTGADWAEILPNLQGTGNLSVENGVLVNMNILQEVFRNLSVIPGLVERLRARLPESYQEKFNARDTVLEPVSIPFAIARENVFTDQLQVATDTFRLYGNGRAALNGRVDSRSVLMVEPGLSEAFIRSVNELEYLTNPKGELQIPLQIFGITPDIRVLPDVPDLASKIAVSKAKDILGDFLQKKTKKEPAPSEPSPPAAEERTTSESLFDRLLKTAVQTASSRTNPQSEGQGS